MKIHEGYARDIFTEYGLPVPRSRMIAKPEDAKEVAERLGAKIIIPMHYKTDALGFPIQPVDDFLKLMERVERANSTTVEIDRDAIGDGPKVVVLDYE